MGINCLSVEFVQCINRVKTTNATFYYNMRYNKYVTYKISFVI